MDTIREKIIQAFVARASGILISGGYNFDLGANVFRGVKEVDPTYLPACTIFPQSDNRVERVGGGECFITFPIRVEAIARFGNENPSVVAEKMLGDLRKGFMGERFSDLVEDVQYISGGTDEYPDANEETITSSAVFSVSYYSKTNDPY